MITLEADGRSSLDAVEQYVRRRLSQRSEPDHERDAIFKEVQTVVEIVVRHQEVMVLEHLEGRESQSHPINVRVRDDLISSILNPIVEC